MSPADPDASPRSEPALAGWRGRRRLAGALFAGALAVYLATGPVWLTSDPLPSRYLPFSILREGNFDLDEFSFLYDSAAMRAYPSPGGIPYFLQREKGHVVSRFSPIPAVLALPVYAIPVWSGLDPRSTEVPVLEKLVAATVVATSVALLFLALLELATLGWAVAIALVYAFGTSSLSLSSQALWEHGPAQLFVAASLYLLVRAKADERLVDWSGLSLSLAVLTRFANVSLALPIAIYVARAHFRRLPGFLLLSLPPVLAVLAYQHAYFGSVWGGHAGYVAPSMWRMAFAEGLAGLLISPGRGLFVYSPVFILVVPGMLLACVRGPRLLRYLAISTLLFTALYAKFIHWWAGYVYGPRYFADLAPILCMLLCPMASLLGSRRAFRATFAALAVLSVAVHALGAFCWDGRWDAEAHLEQGLGALWSWPRNPIAYYAARLPARLRHSWTALRIRHGALPTSSDAPARLSVAYVHRLPIRFEAPASGTLEMNVTALNTGEAVWLAATPDMRGAVRLGWRWLEGGRVVATPVERLDLPYAILPGESYDFEARLMVPGKPGEYELEVGMVDELITWFADKGRKPALHFHVRVVAPPWNGQP